MNTPHRLLPCLVMIVTLFPLNIASSANQNASHASAPPENMVRIGNFFIDIYEFPNTPGALPVTNVTWHDAKALCEAEGKRLCTAEEWVQACRGPQGLRYPYGQEYDGTKCHAESQVDAPLKIGDTPSTCVSGYGVYDLNGNVWEWVGTSLQEGVSVRGGAWSSESCAECALKLWEDKPNTKSDRAGLRCCQ
ncbi:SUMF1/EgtB/PvdO family nonheme iron enzyme [candidate division KSB3 bacterium]|uniref:SUMF1/EgtB/PvdO family nonheme iron enzyme n=1 Tax=candidate division KSB3 bacterium TaxID=2044937 RepID=A0A9D5JTL5_9BACT|nr:SUMF1/EgtB/PvdO family nonheme iron enzyme [candidate division KSB3 bacterium]MBD3323945.1 SUMF1/EgtB/PvdO family nonheme iron enzyme [candidate division KSB3 bacterium]